MRYEDVPEFEKYKYLHQEKFLQVDYLTEEPSIIFIDGKNATKHHNKDMFNDLGYTYHLMESAKKVLKNYDGKYHAFAICDELTIIFENGLDLKKFLNEDCQDCSLSLFTLLFYNEFKKYDNCLFKTFMYKTKAENIKPIIEYRKTMGYYTTLEYFAKEHLPKNKYCNCSVEKIIENLKEANIYDNFLNATQFHDGIEYYYSNDWLDNLLEIYIET